MSPCRPLLGLPSWYPVMWPKSLQLIWRSGTRRWNLRVPHFQISCSDLTMWDLRNFIIVYQDDSSSNGHQGTYPNSYKSSWKGADDWMNHTKPTTKEEWRAKYTNFVTKANNIKSTKSFRGFGLCQITHFCEGSRNSCPQYPGEKFENIHKTHGGNFVF